ncbi:ornithine cyclodeaminase family protein [Ktedonobacter robiniae]|uniref:Ornithine cyclodeaminase n=1 Tax=Ktedonobacter robiniae TaxID=2778365 RepID=A0ABQ3V647_9CHLR|nr:ornithine cyclodeaminase family protein [Ktedonobacter robiniae]GHO60110.1 ornithine cyclodeaminase [Ktedonobacter robiniae]
MNNSNDNILYLSQKEVKLACKEVDSVAVIREVLHLHGIGETILPDEAYLSWKNSHGEAVRSLNMPGYVGGSLNIAGTKIINGNINNPKRGLPRASGLTMLYDDLSVRIVCLMEGAQISSLRTASVTALAVDVLKGRNIHTLAVIGAGILAKAHIELLVQRIPELRSIRIYDLDVERIHALESELAPFLGEYEVAMRLSSSAEEAIRDAQLIVPTTTTTTGYIQYEWLQRGSILVNVSLDDALPEVVLKADLAVVDDWHLVKSDPRRLLGRMYRQGQIVGPDDVIEHHTGEAPRRIDAQLGEIVAGKKSGRRSLDDIVYVNPFGLAIEDVAMAAHVYQSALKLDLGIWLSR